MPTIDTYRKQAKLLVRWHRERNYSIGEKFRLLERYRHLTDIEALDTPLPLTVAQEIVAVEAGFRNWAALRASTTDVKRSSRSVEGKPACLSAVPILFVRNVRAAAAFYADRLGFQVDFLSRQTTLLRFRVARSLMPSPTVCARTQLRGISIT